MIWELPGGTEKDSLQQTSVVLTPHGGNLSLQQRETYTTQQTKTANQNADLWSQVPIVKSTAQLLHLTLKGD